MLAEAAAASVPECPGGDALAAHIMSETMRLLPKELSRRAA
jgi:hypothetical protein